MAASNGWNLLAAHVRSNHVHTIVEAETRPEKVQLVRQPRAEPVDKRPDRAAWKHPWLWKEEDVRHALQYEIDEQGEAMVRFVAEDL